MNYLNRINNNLKLKQDIINGKYGIQNCTKSELNDKNSTGRCRQFYNDHKIRNNGTTYQERQEQANKFTEGEITGGGKSKRSRKSRRFRKTRRRR